MEQGHDDGTECQKATKNQEEPGNDDGTEYEKTRETSPGTLAGNKRNQEIMMEQSQKNRETGPETVPGTRRNQEMTVEQNARRVGRQAPERYPETDGTRK